MVIAVLAPFVLALGALLCVAMYGAPRRATAAPYAHALHTTP